MSRQTIIKQVTETIEKAPRFDKIELNLIKNGSAFSINFFNGRDKDDGKSQNEARKAETETE